ncbi:hypothetical protein [Kitasatospora sp. LaBMicrA B282]|uniref:hypothetical protein n=1 Tax=Kitasatospora sp. LaBMicrA B282 TaxID=3420949 RepID=UPI003D0C03E7
MDLHRTTAAPLALAIGAVLSVAGCSSGAKGGAAASVASGAAGSAASALQSGAASAISQAASAANSLSSSAASALASAQSAAASAVAGATSGLDATADVTLGAVAPASDHRVQVPLTVTNHQSGAERYTIQVDFKDSGGKLLDVTVVQVPPVQPGSTATATATSNLPLTGTVTAGVDNALRY